jgi:hypothetical protein
MMPHTLPPPAWTAHRTVVLAAEDALHEQLARLHADAERTRADAWFRYALKDWDAGLDDVDVRASRFEWDGTYFALEDAKTFKRVPTQTVLIVPGTFDAAAVARDRAGRHLPPNLRRCSAEGMLVGTGDVWVEVRRVWAGFEDVRPLAKARGCARGDWTGPLLIEWDT